MLSAHFEVKIEDDYTYNHVLDFEQVTILRPGNTNYNIKSDQETQSKTDKQPNKKN